jgi:type II secretory pathway component GspD/PulD (secretin)
MDRTTTAHMKSNITIGIVCCAKRGAGFAAIALAGLLCLGLTACCTGTSAKAKPRTFSSFDMQSGQAGQAPLGLGALNFQNADLTQVLAIYQDLSGRTVIRGNVPMPTITVQSHTPLNRIQALQLLDTVLAEQGIAMVLSGDLAVKAVPQARANAEAPPEINRPWRELPDSGSFMMCTVRLKRNRPSELVPALQPFAKVPNSILAIDSSRLLILRDYSANIRRMLKLIEELEKPPGA